jgi:hypothetical protein
MAVSRTLRRLLRVRELEEEQCRLALESAQGGLTRLERALAGTVERARGGRRLVEASARTGELADRFAGLEESIGAERLAQVLSPRIEAAQEEVILLREEFLAKRVEVRQAETLIGETEARDAVEAARRGQQALDDWHRSRQFRRAGNGSPAQSSDDLPTGREASAAEGDESPGPET